MSRVSSAPSAPVTGSGAGRLVSVALSALLVGGGVGYGAFRVLGSAQPAAAPAPAATEEKPAEPDVVEFSESKWKSAGVTIEPVTYAPFTERIWRSGHLILNETAIAHLSPVVEGIIREVKVRLGQEVKAGEVLAVLDCREVGQAKLDLVKARLATEYARNQSAWTQTVTKNATELVQATTAGETIPEIEKRFANRPIGEIRQQIITAYSRRLQAKAHYDAVTQADTQGAISQANIIRLRADLEAAEASFRALTEEVKFQSGQQVRAAEQKLREAQTAEALSQAALMMFGYSREEVAAMDPIAEGARVSLYPIRAPFSGTIIEQHAVLAERVSPQIQLFKIADLSVLWLHADVPQRDHAFVRKLTGGKIRFREDDESGKLYQGDVFYKGDLIEPETRAISLSASVPNEDRSLKPGMFVEVEFLKTGEAAVQVPATAVQRDNRQAFVFVHEGGDRFKRVNVKLGRSNEGTVEISDGLKPGQNVVTGGAFVLKSELMKDQMMGE